MDHNDDNHDSKEMVRVPIDPIDPIEALPSELVGHLFSFLPPRSLAKSNAVSKDWRKSVLSNPILRNQIDFFHLGVDTDISQFLKYFE